MDMKNKFFEGTEFGQEALRMLGPVPENFRLFSAGWAEVSNDPKDWKTFKVTGAEFTKAGKLIPGTKRSVKITKARLKELHERKYSATDQTTDGQATGGVEE